MTKIKNITAREILDSRGNPTVEADVILEDGSTGRASVPSGASTGENEAVELRDRDDNRYGGQGVLKAVKNIKEDIFNILKGESAEDQKNIDQKMIDLDGTKNKSKLGANAILAVSLSCAKAVAKQRQIPLYEYFATLIGRQLNTSDMLPLPMSNIINGGKHADHSTDIQEFMIMPVGARNFTEAIRMLSEVFHSLKSVLKDRGYRTTVGDEGGFAPTLKGGNIEALDLISLAVKNANYILGQDVVFALDVAASELFDGQKYNLKTENRQLSSEEMINFYKELMNKFPIVSIEDGLSEDDWDGWQLMNANLGSAVQLVGDDLLVTNSKFLAKAIKEKACNAILIKPNQIGTLTETISTVNLANQAGFKTIISHRSGETEDTALAHLAVGLGIKQIKTGSISRTDRVAKYNELLRIEEGLGDRAKFANLN